MDNMIRDPELAFEMVGLLMQELKVVRAQFRESERVRLLCDFLRSKLTTSTIFQRNSTPNMGGHSNDFTHEREQELIAENETLKADNAVLQERLARLQEGFIQSSSIKSEEDLPTPLRCTEVVTPAAACPPRTTNKSLFSQRLTRVENLPD